MVQLVNPDQPFHRHVSDQDTATPRGILSTAEISATERQSRQNPRMAWHSGLRLERSRAS